MDPASIALAMAVGTGTQMVGQYQAGIAAEEQGEREQAWHEYNARLEKREAKEAAEAASYEESKVRKESVRTKAAQRVRYAKAGVTFEGSPMDVLDKTASEYAMDALLIRRSGQLASQRHLSRAQLDLLAGRSALLRGRSARRASRYKMAGTGLTGASQIGYSYGRMTGEF